ncbi:MAG: hypothetical protein K2M42_05970 [Oscillospiraceae bacterium]|nr:hypothetical protein [Oscillospiraceae bacterium]
MTLQNLLAGGAIVALLSIVQISPLKINPWSPLIRLVKRLLRRLLSHLGRATNGDVLAKLDELSKAQEEMQKKLNELEARLNEHIRTDDNREADAHRTRILRFNNELLRGIPHTKEMFIQVLAEIDAYEDYCDAHEDYSNNRAVLAIANIRENYLERLRERDFLQDGKGRDDHAD